MLHFRRHITKRRLPLSPRRQRRRERRQRPIRRRVRRNGRTGRQTDGRTGRRRCNERSATNENRSEHAVVAIMMRGWCEGRRRGGRRVAARRALENARSRMLVTRRAALLIRRVVVAGSGAQSLVRREDRRHRRQRVRDVPTEQRARFYTGRLQFCVRPLTRRFNRLFTPSWLNLQAQLQKNNK